MLEKLQNPEWWIDRMCNDLYFLCRLILITLEDTTPGFKDLYRPTHKHMCDFVTKYAVEGNKLLILMPRAWLKSYIITTGWTLQRLIRNVISGQREHFIISNATGGNARGFLERIQHNLGYNDFLRNFLLTVVPESTRKQLLDLQNKAERWTLDEMQLSGNKIETGSVEGNLVSRHYKVMINDDLVNWDNSRTADQLEKTKSWWKLARSLMVSDGIEMNIGTRWHYDDLYGNFIDKFIEPKKDYAIGKPFVELHNGNYHLLQYSCYENPIEKKGSTFPNLYPEWKLHELEQEQEDAFGGQYMNDPLEMSNNPFKKKNLKYYRENDLPPIRMTLMCVDPSGKANERSDYSAISVIECASDKNVYIRFAQRKLVTDMKLMEWIIEVAMQYQPALIGIEDTKCNSLMEIIDICIQRMKVEGHIPEEQYEYVKMLPQIIQEVASHGRPKELRIKNLTGKFETGNWLLSRYHTDDLVEELLRFPSTHDDIADALAYCQDLVVFPRPDEPVKALIVPEYMKLTQEERERRDWERYLEDAYAHSPMNPVALFD
jgi:hypothetical protein